MIALGPVVLVIVSLATSAPYLSPNSCSYFHHTFSLHGVLEEAIDTSAVAIFNFRSCTVSTSYLIPLTTEVHFPGRCWNILDVARFLANCTLFFSCLTFGVFMCNSRFLCVSVQWYHSLDSSVP